MASINEPSERDNGQAEQRTEPSGSAGPGTSGVPAGGGRGGWFSRQPGAVQAAVITGIFGLITVLIVFTLENFSRNGPTPTAIPPLMLLTVRVENQQIPGTSIQNARVTLDAPGHPPMVQYTDSIGVAVFSVPSDSIGLVAGLKVDAANFTPWTQNVTVTGGALSLPVQLTPQQ